ncbi:MAG TPA: anaerobic ribonucleoside-triphosphate reductase activating protein [bacterium]
MIRSIIETSLIDWDGKISMVLFFDRCDFHCPFCQNHGFLEQRDAYDEIPAEKILTHVKKRRKWIDGVVLSGGEPLAYGEQAVAFMRALKTTGTALKLDTHGYHNERLQTIVQEGLVDYVAMDIKAPLEPKKYTVATGLEKAARTSQSDRSVLALVKASTVFLMNGSVDYEFRTTCVPGIIDDEAVAKIGEKIAGARKWALQVYRPGNARLKKSYPKGYKPAEMAQLLAIARQYVGNAILRGDTPD